MAKDAKARKAPPSPPRPISARTPPRPDRRAQHPLGRRLALYMKTKNFHWHVSGPHFRDYHLLLDEQADQIFAMTDDIAERVRKMGGETIRSIGHIAAAAGPRQRRGLR